ncbi:class III extradiol ring-cleavage dioxygenase [Hyphomonas sp.]|uniref:DODA-type extradiol aromatic ring-opening family dioxygenase n=1 Tax=Hyphomonas sp. TaxID=87 RepID=UPI0025C66E39|nr:class III extradiol ring-cleavage dioxygenase [Hyphomonas sp.]
MPTLFIPHGGGPCFFMDWTMMGGPADTWDDTAAWLKSIPASLPEKPKALLVVSAHWEETEFTVSTAAAPDMIFDYYGFPQHTYELSYPAPGAPELAKRVQELMTSHGLPAPHAAERGYDHGVFVPLLVAFPDADIPILTLSLTGDLSPEKHLQLGKALSGLRDEGVLIIGSGMSYHNMRAFRTPAATAPSAEFDTWLTEALTGDDPERRWAQLSNWLDAPQARNSHPREEHLLPLMVAAGAAEGDIGEKVFSDNVMNATVSAFRFG